MKVLILKLDFTRFFACLGYKTLRLLAAGLAALFLCYGSVVHAEAVYSFSKTMGGTDHDFGQSVAVDSSGNVYITGYFSGTVDFNPDNAATDNHTSSGLEDIFLTKINSNGSYGFTKTMGGTDHDFGQSVAVDSGGNVYITGYFSGTADFDPDNAATDNHTSSGLEDIFLTKINSNGSYGFTKTMGGTDHDFGQSVAVDSGGNVYITGYFSGTADFDPDNAATDNHTSSGLEDIFLTKINSNGSYGFTKTMGGTDHDFGQSVAVDSGGNVYITGYFSGTADFDPDNAATDNHTSSGLEDIFLTKINSNGSYGFTKTMGGTDHDFGQSVAVDSGGNVYITGYFSDTADFDPDNAATDNHTSSGLEDIFLTKINSNGSYGFTKTMGGTDHDFGQSVAVDSGGNVYITGYFSDTADFDPDNAATDNHTSSGLEDIFLTKINFDGSYDLTTTIGGTDQDLAQSIVVDDDVNVYITGSFRGTVDFDPSSGTDNHTSAGLEDIYLTKFRLVGFVVTPASVTTTGAGDTATFTAKLLSEPSANVTLPVSSSNLTIGTVSTSRLTFTNINWFVDQTVTVTSLVSSSQTYSIILGSSSSADVDYDGLNPTDVTVANVGSDSGSSGGCFIATAAYGSLMEPHVKILRDFRDRFMIGNTAGKIFVRLYYTYSPPVADFIAKHDSLRTMVRISLLPLVSVSWIILKIGTESTVALMLIFISCFVGLVRFRKRYKD